MFRQRSNFLPGLRLSQDMGVDRGFGQSVQTINGTVLVGVEWG